MKPKRLRASKNKFYDDEFTFFNSDQIIEEEAIRRCGSLLSVEYIKILIDILRLKTNGSLRIKQFNWSRFCFRGLTGQLVPTLT